MLTDSLSSRYLLTSPSAFPAAGRGEAGGTCVLLSQLGQCQPSGIETQAGRGRKTKDRVY